MSGTQAVDDTKLEVGALLTDYVQNDFKLSMWIPKDLGGKVIGKRGVVITNLQRETKAKQINALQPVGNSSWIAVVILGGYKNVILAYDAISEIVDHEVDGVVLEFMINYKKPFFLYGGRKFHIIKRISADTQVRVFFPDFNPKEQSYSEALPFSLEGECVNVQQAVVELEKEAASYRVAQTAKFASRGIEYDPNAERPMRGAKDSGREEREPRERVPREGREAPRAPVPAPVAVTHAPPAAPITANNTVKVQKIFDLVNQNERSNASRQNITNTLNNLHTAPVMSSSPPHPENRKSLHHDEMEVDEDDKKVKIEKTVEIPSTLVGLLLSKKPKAKATIMNQIQHMTHTVISKIINPDTLADPNAVEEGEDASGSRRRRDAASESESESESDDEKRGKSGKARSSVKRTKPVFINSENVFVTFRIMGYTEESCDMVIEHLKRIVAGDRIKTVMDDLRESARGLKYEGNPKYRSSSAPVKHDDANDRYHVSAMSPRDQVYEPRKLQDGRIGAVGDIKKRPQPAPGVAAGLVTVAPESSEDHRGVNTRIRHTQDGAIFEGPRIRGGRGGEGRGRAEYAGGRGRDFGKDPNLISTHDTRPPREPRGPRIPREDREERSEGRGGRGRGRGGRGRGRSGPPENSEA